MLRVILRWNWRLCTDLLAFNSRLRKTSLGDSLMKYVQPVITSLGSLTSKYIYLILVWIYLFSLRDVGEVIFRRPVASLECGAMEEEDEKNKKKRRGRRIRCLHFLAFLLWVYPWFLLMEHRSPLMRVSLSIWV